MKNITHNQHYVPQFYLRNFSSTSQKSNSKMGLAFYQFDKGLLKENIPIKSICSEEYFYDKDGSIENALQVCESIWADAIRDLLDENKRDISQETSNTIKTFAIYQYSRTRSTLNYFQKITNELSEAINSIECTSTSDNREISSTMLLKHCPELIKDILDLSICKIINRSEKAFITSDMPIITINPFANNSYGMSNVGIVLLFPISEKMMIGIYDRKVYSKIASSVFIYDESDVDAFNYYQMISAEERVLSSTKDCLRFYVDNNNLLNLRNQFHDEFKTHTAGDDNGKLTHIKARGLPFKFKIPFFNIPKYIENIPCMCKHGLLRNYDRTQRVNLIYMERLTFEELKGTKFESNINQIRSGYTKVHKYMDKYWNVTKKERKITDRLAQISKHTFIPSSNYFQIANNDCNEWEA